MNIRIALVGNPNSGKTTMFNDLTGSNQYVGNWPGVTVEKKEGKLKKYNDVIITDLPGVYSLSPYTLEEVVSRNYLVNERPDAVINLVDASNLERNLYLTTQLTELGLPVLLALNKYDLVKRSGDKIDTKKLSEELGVEVVETSALRGEGMKELAQKAVELAKRGKPSISSLKYSKPVENALTEIEDIFDEVKLERMKSFDKLHEAFHTGEFDEEAAALRDELAHRHMHEVLHQRAEGTPVGHHHEDYSHTHPEWPGNESLDNDRWYAIKLFERDEEVLKQLNLDSDTRNKLESIVSTVEKEADDDAESIIANDRYDYIGELMSSSLHKKQAGLTTSDKIDKVVTNRWLGLPIFIIVMVAVYMIAVTFVGMPITDWTNDVFFGEWIQPAVDGWLSSIGAADWVNSLLVDGIIGGVGAVLGFVPQMFVLFFLLGMLEDCGYMARVAFVMDRVFRRFGLSGKSFIPFLISSGCGIPGIMATRTIENDRDRRMTIMTTTFIPCGAKLPVIALIGGAVFGGAWWVAPAIYFMGFFAIILAGVILKKTSMFKGRPAPFIMELPQYHWPAMKNVFKHMWDRVRSFIVRAGTIIFIAAVIIWALSTFGFADGSFGFVDQEDSLLAVIGGWLAVIFVPLGFGIWQAAAATLSGLGAKEVVVATFAVLLGLSGETEAGDPGLWSAVADLFPNTAAAISFLVFNMLTIPCMAAVGTMAKEMNSNKWTFFTIGFWLVFSYAISLMVYQFGALIEGEPFSAWTVVAIVVAVVFLFLLFRPQPKDKKIGGGGSGMNSKRTMLDARPMLDNQNAINNRYMQSQSVLTEDAVRR